MKTAECTVNRVVCYALFLKSSCFFFVANFNIIINDTFPAQSVVVRTLLIRNYFTYKGKTQKVFLLFFPLLIKHFRCRISSLCTRGKVEMGKNI